jgi:hypothetical protein
MKIQEPIPHWNNFTVPELKEILEHCTALERLGIAQDEEMMVSIERDIALRDKKMSRHHALGETRPVKRHSVQNRNRPSKIIRNGTKHPKQVPQEYVLEQNVQ